MHVLTFGNDLRLVAARPVALTQTAAKSFCLIAPVAQVADGNFLTTLRCEGAGSLVRPGGTFGVPGGAYHHQDYRILVWPRGVNLLAGLRLNWFVLVWRHVIGSPPVWWMASSRFSTAV